MAIQAQQPPASCWRQLVGCVGILRFRSWDDVVDLALVLWIVRVPLASLLVGFAFLYYPPQAQDLLVGLVVSSWRIVEFFVVLTLVWAMPTHYAARLLLEADGRLKAYKQRLAQAGNAVAQRALDRLGSMETCIPRLFGIVPYLLFYIGVVRSYKNLPIIKDPEYIPTIKFDLLLFAVFLVFGIVVFAAYACNRRALAARAPRLLTPTTGHALLVILFAAVLALLFLRPNWAAEWFPRAIMIAVIIGGWLPFLSLLSAWGRRWRAPLIVATLAGITLLTGLLGDNHSVRRINAQEVGGQPVARLTLNAAVDRWTKANHCVGADCPRPIIIAASGGASRAGFFTVSIVGHLLQEAERGKIEVSGRKLTPDDIRNRLFAISPISGSSVGAVMMTTALMISKDGHHPCAAKPFKLWFGVTVNYWRDCLEAFMSGDFLTPAIIGLAFHDTLPFLGRTDRARLLEQSWERRFAEVLAPEDQRVPRLPCANPLQCPFLMLQPTADHWIPLLLINGTSVQTGRRIVTTALSPTYDAKPGRCPTAHDLTDSGKCLLLNQTMFFHDLINGEEKENNKNDLKVGFWAWIRLMTNFDYLHGRKLDDVSISTAAHNSARFPVVSPPGAVRNHKHEVVDRIVDGGYFENYGALTALELAQAIRAVNENLAPFVLVISNDPNINVDHEDDEKGPSAREDSKTINSDPAQFLPDVSDTLETFLQSWDSRATLAVGQLRAAQFRELPQCDVRVSHVRVWPQTTEDSDGTRAVSMSWWLSEPVQRHLHQQTEHELGQSEAWELNTACPPAGKNDNKNCPPLKKVWKALTATPACAQPKP